MSIYSDKLAHIQVVINCWYSVAQMCTREDILAHKFQDLKSRLVQDFIRVPFA